MSFITRWQPLKEIQALRQQMDRLFEDLIHYEPNSTKFTKGWMPAIEVQETDTDLLVKAEVPGMAAADLDVRVGNDRVEISGEHREETNRDEKGVFHSELHYGKFSRIVPLPVKVQPEAVVAEFKDGVVKLTIPKAEPHQRTIVKVNLAEQLRETATQQRQTAEQLEADVSKRAMESLETSNGERFTPEMRETVVQQRQAERHIQETTHQRAVDPATV